MTHEPSVTTSPRKERIALGAFGVLAAATVTLMVWAHDQPRVTCDATGQSETLPACKKAALTATQAAVAGAKYEKLTQTAIAQDKAGTAAASHTTVQKMRDDWDADATSLQAVNTK